MSAARVIAAYEKLLALTQRMAEAARREEWDALIDCEARRRQVIEELKVLDAQTPLDAATQHRKNAAINAILAHDAEIRGCIESWMAELQRNMRSNLQEQRLLREYGR